MEILVYELVESNIHRFQANKAHRQVADDFVAQFAPIYNGTKDDGYVLLLVDIRPDGMPPISYMLNRLRDMFAELDRSVTIYAAYLYEESIVLGLLSTFMDTLRLPSSRRLFKGDQEDVARAWLREQEAVYKQK